MYTHLLVMARYKLSEIKKMINGTIDDQSPSNTTTQPKASFAEIGVYFQSLNKKLVYEEPKYTVRLRFDFQSRCRVARKTASDISL